MPAKKTKTTAKATTKKSAAKKKSEAPKKLSALDAAARVLVETGGSMTTKELIEAMAAKKLWESSNGKTPAATLYAAILREINTKGKDSRFKKTEPGQFAATATKADAKPATPKTTKPKAAKPGKKKAAEPANTVAAANTEAPAA